MKTFLFRAEFPEDMTELRRNLPKKLPWQRIRRAKLPHEAELPDYEPPNWRISLYTKQEVAMLLKAMVLVDDGHRMLQTIDLEENYTGHSHYFQEERSKRILDLLPENKTDLRIAYLQELGLTKERFDYREL